MFPKGDSERQKYMSQVYTILPLHQKRRFSDHPHCVHRCIYEQQLSLRKTTLSSLSISEMASLQKSNGKGGKMSSSSHLPPTATYLTLLAKFLIIITKRRTKGVAPNVVSIMFIKERRDTSIEKTKPPSNSTGVAAPLVTATGQQRNHQRIQLKSQTRTRSRSNSLPYPVRRS